MQVALPFGAKAAVNGFIRSARFLQWVALKCLTILNSCYFDDFATFSVPVIASNTDACMSMLMDLLGWAFDREGPKADQFGPTLSVLGVEIDLGRSDEGTVFIANTAKRRDELVQRIEAILSAGSLTKQMALELRGRLAFAESQIMGLAGQRGLKEVTTHAHARLHNPLISPALDLALRDLKERLLHSPPRKITCHTVETWLIFTDAAFEPEPLSGGVGGVLVDPQGKVRAWFGLTLSADLVGRFMSLAQRTCVGELETLAATMAILLWGNHICSRQCVMYVDNEGAKYALTKGHSNNPTVGRLVHLARASLEDRDVISWFARVPSASNIADPPSRNCQHPLLAQEKCEPEEAVRNALATNLACLDAVRTEPVVKGRQKDPGSA